MNKQMVIRQISKSVELYIGDPDIKSPAFATAKQLAGAFSYKDVRSFRENFLPTIEPVYNTDLYCIADLADAIFSHEVPVKPTRKGRNRQDTEMMRMCKMR